MNALNTAINVYFVNVIFPRLSLPSNTIASYNLDKSELTIQVPDEPVKGEADGQPAEPSGESAAGKPAEPAGEPAAKPAESTN